MLKLLSENVAFTQALAPASRTEVGGTSGVYTGTYVAMNDFSTALVLLSLGDVTAGDTVDLALVQATSSGGAGVKVIEGASITQVTDTADNTLYAIEVGADQLDAANSFAFIAPRLTIAGASAAVLSTVTVLRHNARQKPVTNGLTQSIEVVS